jgi:hypothetical protein
VATSVLQVTGPNAIVDWVLVELRSTVAPHPVVATRSALLQRDGDIVGTNGSSPVVFNNPAGNYMVSVRHRNHLGIMTLGAQTLSAVATVVDFRTGPGSAWGTNAMKNDNGVWMMWAGNAYRDLATGGQQLLKYTNAENDRDAILVVVGGVVPTGTVAGYYREDTNLSGVVKYTGQDNDRDLILLNIGGVVPTNTRAEQLPY